MMRKLNVIIIIVLIAFQGLHSEDALKLIHPNGGDVLKSGEVTKITWEGLSAEELVKLNFSTDNGETWNTIADSINGSTYDWVAPLVESDSCLVSVHSILEKYSEGENGEIEWSKTFGGSGNQKPSQIIQTLDGGYLVLGETTSHDYLFPDNKGSNDIWLLKLNSTGEQEWSRTYGGSQSDKAAFILKQDSDGGFIIAGTVLSEDGDITNSRGRIDGWIFKVDANGNMVWDKNYGGKSHDLFSTFQRTKDDGYIIVGSTRSGGEESGRGYNYWVLKLNSEYEEEWSKSYGGDVDDRANYIEATIDGGYIIGGVRDIEVNENTLESGLNDYWIVKISVIGDIEWEKSFGGSDQEQIRSIHQLKDGKYLIFGNSASIDGDLENIEYNGKNKGWILKLDTNGEKIWSKTYGEESFFFKALVMDNEEFLLCGYLYGKKGTKTETQERDNLLLIRLNSDGEIKWEQTFGTLDSETGTSVIETKDGSYAVAGFRDVGLIKNGRSKFNYWIFTTSGKATIISNSDTSDAVFSIVKPLDETIIQAFNYFIYTNEQNSTVTATVILEENTNINLEIYDVLGRRVVDLYSGEAMIGKNEYTVNFAEFQSGRYYIKLTTPTITKTEILEVVR